MKLVRICYAASPVLTATTVGDFPHVDLTDVDEGGTGSWSAQGGAERGRAALLMETGDVAYGRLRPYLRKTFLADQSLTCSTEFLVLRCGRDVVPRYLAHILRDSSFAHRVSSLVEGAKMPRASWEEIRNVRISLFPLDIQRQVGDFLDDEGARLAELSDHLHVLAELAEAHFDSVLHERLMQPLPRTTLGRLCTLQRGLDLPEERREEGIIPVVGSGGIVGRHNSTPFQGPGLVTGRYGSVGAVHWCDGPYWPLNTTLYVKDFKGNQPRWLYYVLRALPLRAGSAKSAVPGLHRADANRMEVTTLGTTEQATAAAGLLALEEQLDALRQEIEVERDALAEYRDALVTEAVSGKLDVMKLSEQQLDESAHAAMEGERPEVLSA